MIRPDLMKAVFAALESHRYLSREDFVLEEYSNSEKDPCLRIEYRYDKSLFLKFHIPKQRTKTQDQGHAYRFNCTMRPGRESVEEALNAEERSGLLAEIKAWVVRLYDDVVSAPAVRQFQEHARAIDELAERLEALPDEPMSRSDVSAFAEGLEKLKTELTEELKQQSSDKEELKTRVEELTNDIEFLKRTLDSMTKRQWGEMFAARVQRWKTRLNLRQLSAGVKVARLLMPSGASEALDGVAEAIDGIADAVDGKPKPPIGV